MAITSTQTYDTRYRTNVKYVVNADANSTVSLLDVSGLVGHQAAPNL